jgi:hypothetical protein
LRILERAGFLGDMGRGLEYLFEVVEVNALEAGIAALQIQLASIILPAGILFYFIYICDFNVHLAKIIFRNRKSRR